MNILIWSGAIILLLIGIKIDDNIIKIFAYKYKDKYRKFGQPDLIYFFSPRQAIVNTVYHFKIIFQGNFIDKSNKELDSLISKFRILTLILIVFLLFFSIDIN